jgi:hypothetical protein
MTTPDKIILAVLTIAVIYSAIVLDHYSKRLGICEVALTDTSN